MSQRAPVPTEEFPALRPAVHADGTGRALRRRRAQAMRVRRRRLLVADVAFGLALALLGLLLVPGLAYVAVLALVVLAGCGVSLVVGRVRRRRRARRLTGRRSVRR